MSAPRPTSVGRDLSTRCTPRPPSSRRVVIGVGARACCSTPRRPSDRTHEPLATVPSPSSNFAASRRELIAIATFFGAGSLFVAARAVAEDCVLNETPSGLKYCDLAEGTGPEVVSGTLIKANYTGRLASTSKIFDSSYPRGQPLVFKVGAREEGSDVSSFLPSSRTAPAAPAVASFLLTRPSFLTLSIRGPDKTSVLSYTGVETSWGQTMRSAFSAAAFRISWTGLQLASRLLTFLLNLLVVRRLSPSVYGLAAFRLPLLNTALLLLSREAFRRGCLRKREKAAETKGQELRSVLPLATLPIPIGLFWAVLFFLYFSRSEQTDIPWAVLCEHAVAFVVELLSEPLYIVASLWLEFGLRARVEGLAVFTKSLATFLLATFTNRDAALAFADAQILYALVLLIGYATLIPRIADKLRPSAQKEMTLNWHLDRGKLRLSGVFFIQTCEKLILAEGSKFVLMRFKSLYDEGVYGLVNNLGSLVVRVLFQPFEEAAFTAFSRAGVSEQESKQGRTADVLSALARCVFLIGWLPMVCGPPSSALFLRLLYSETWSRTSAPTVLAWYCPYIGLMALNGIAEAFVHAVLDERGLALSNLFMLFSALLHVSLSILLVQGMGAVGLVMADGVNMIGRISFALWCIRRHFSGMPSFSISELAPHPGSLTAGLAVSAALHFCSRVLERMQFPFHVQVALYGSIAAVLLGILLWVLWRTERRALKVLFQLRQTRAADKTD